MATTRRKAPPKNLTKDAMGQEIKTIACLGIGLVIGSMSGNVLNKILKIDASDTRMSLKKFIPPLTLTGAGTIGAIKLEGETLRNISKGVAISGILSGVKVIMPKVKLNGLEGFEGIEGMGQTDAFGEPLGVQDIPVYYEPDLLQLNEAPASIGSYEPELPELQASEISGYAYDNEPDNIQTEISAVENVDYEII